MSNQRKFTDEEKEQIKEIAIALEYELEVESKFNDDLVSFSQWPQLVEAIERAKEKLITEPDFSFDLTPWLFWSPLEEWFCQSDARACRLVFKFSAAIKGFPYEAL